MVRYGKRPIRRKPRNSVRRRTAAPTAKVTVRKTVRLAPKRAVNRNRLAIRRLGMRLYGQIQKCCVVGTVKLFPTTLKPILFDMSDFTRKYSTPEYDHNSHGGLIYQLDAAGALAQAAQWQLPAAVISNNPFMQFQNDIVDGGKYLAMWNYTQLRIAGLPQVSNVRVRVQVFTQNMNAVYNTQTPNPPDSLLPDALVHLKQMANFTVGNFLPKKFFKIIYDRTVFMNSASVPSQGAHGTTANVKYLNVPWKPRGGKLVRQRITAPTSNTGATTLPEPSRGYFGPDVRNPGELTWCLISCDDRASDDPQIEITFKSKRCWRDAQGAY